MKSKHAFYAYIIFAICTLPIVYNLSSLCNDHLDGDRNNTLLNRISINSVNTPKSADWDKDVDLENTDASFIGESEDDNSGWSVAGAGDVNGDGQNIARFEENINTGGIQIYFVYRVRFVNKKNILL